ncbi:hypothetical protein INT46_004847 [Mucor plumbeus]|uniref:SWIRM domain-containing protein n=1 Tax=Mucor plumbeus TaxID=97098 RepID=A0A8H7QFB5_9FUNG|nr:hypothetical protein INT46_004847 [Mucor plumbeus]
MSFITKENYNYNKRFISPPVTPKQHLESCFMKSNIMEHYNTVVMPPSPPPCSTSSPPCGLRESSFDSSSTTSGNSMAFSQNRRKQRTPSRSPPSTTKGTFRMPLDVFAKALNTISYQESNDTTTIETTVTIATPTSEAVKERKRKRGNGCITPTPALEQEEQQEQQQEKVKINNSNSTRNNAFSLSSILLPSSPLSSSVAPIEQVEFIKKSGTGAAHIYDNLSADCDQTALFLNSEEWIPNLEVFNRKPTIRVSWKGSPLKIKTMPYFDKLHSGEVTIAATLRLTPEQYLKCKWALVLAAKEASETGALFRKSEAQKVCCIDVNKTSVLWNTFVRLGWLGSKWPQ